MAFDDFEVAAIVLAAGESKRLGKPKQLLKINNKTLIEITLDALSKSNISKQLAITGKHHDLISQVLPEEQWVAQHKHNNVGIGSSIAFGVNTLLERSTPKAILVTLSDQPFMSDSHIDRLIATLREADNKCDAIATRYNEKNLGVPALFSPNLYANLQKLSGDVGAKELLNSDDFSVIGITPDFDTRDVDTDEDFELIST